MNHVSRPVRKLSSWRVVGVLASVVPKLIDELEQVFAAMGHGLAIVALAKSGNPVS
jgi:hypothetical protein